MTAKLIVVVATIAILMLLERKLPFFSVHNSWRSRIISNLELGLLNSIAASLFVIMMVAIGNAVALSAPALALPQPQLLQTIASPAVVTTLSLLILDLYMYLWHRAMHSFPLAWRFHRVHHTDRSMNVTTAYRFHPIEVLAANLPKLGLIWLLGISPNMVLTYELIFTVVVGWQHSNVALPQSIERLLAHLVVTPTYHRIHHSQIVAETQSNYGSVLTCWDRLFGTQTSEVLHAIQLGVSDECRELNVWQLIELPLTTTPHPTTDL